MSRRKNRPDRGTKLEPGMSERDIAAALGVSRRWIWQAKLCAEVSDGELERWFADCRSEGKMPTSGELANLARGRATPKRHRPAVCPHCGGKL